MRVEQNHPSSSLIRPKTLNLESPPLRKEKYKLKKVWTFRRDVNQGPLNLKLTQGHSKATPGHSEMSTHTFHQLGLFKSLRRLSPLEWDREAVMAAGQGPLPQILEHKQRHRHRRCPGLALHDSSRMIHAAILVPLLSRVGSKMAEAVFRVDLRLQILERMRD